jgi:hypothetical protein
MVETPPAGGVTGGGIGLAAARVTAPHFGQNGAVTGVPQLLQNLAVGAGRLGGVTPGGRVALAVADVAAPHLLQNTPLTGDPHLLQKFAMVCFLLSSLTRLNPAFAAGSMG